MSAADVLANLDKYADDTLRAFAAATSYTAQELENRLKQNAPWTDDTTNARNSLAGSWGWEGDDLRLVASGGMTYSVFLELANGKKYAVLQPEIDKIAPEWQAQIKRVAGK